MSFGVVGWWIVLDTHGEIVEREKPSSVAFLDANWPDTYYHTLFL
jgi:hypothetical protein